MSTPDPAIAFYGPLATISLTLLGVWFAVLQFSHGSWQSAVRHRSTLHIALHFLLPGMAGLASLLATGTEDGLIWRITFLAAGLGGTVESLAFLRDPHGPRAIVGRALCALDPALYTAMAGAAFLPKGALPITPLQTEGMITGTLFLFGLCYVWLAFAEREVPAEPEPSVAGR
ncbi:MAG: hypothetical protein L0H84_01470 [Pseudonocardia sp.]|nr:hypothetical protein [Pseudonocardia sp.]